MVDSTDSTGYDGGKGIPEPPKTNVKSRVPSRAERSRQESPFVATAGKYRKSDGGKDAWDGVDDVTIGGLPDVSAIQKAFPGFTFRWVRTMKNGKEDTSNMLDAVRLGWQVVQEDDVPRGVSIPHLDMDGVGRVVGISGLVLAMMPEARHKAINRQYEEDADRASKTVGMEIREIGKSATPLRKVSSARVQSGPRVQSD